MSLARGATAPLAGAAGGPPLPAGAPLTAPPLAGPPRVTPPLAAAPRGGIPLPLEPRTLGYCRDDLQQVSQTQAELHLWKYLWMLFLFKILYNKTKLQR